MLGKFDHKFGFSDRVLMFGFSDRHIYLLGFSVRCWFYSTGLVFIRLHVVILRPDLYFPDHDVGYLRP